MTVRNPVPRAAPGWLPWLGKAALAAVLLAVLAVLLRAYAEPVMTLAMDFISYCF